MAWEEFWELARERWPDLEKPKTISGRTAGRLKRDLIGEYGQQPAIQLLRMAVLDWEAIQDVLWKASRRGIAPSVEDVIDLRDSLAPYLQSGVTSAQHRVSRFQKRFLKDKKTSAKKKAKTSGTNGLRSALKKRRR